MYKLNLASQSHSNGAQYYSDGVPLFPNTIQTSLERCRQLWEDNSSTVVLWDKSSSQQADMLTMTMEIPISIRIGTWVCVCVRQVTGQFIQWLLPRALRSLDGPKVIFICHLCIFTLMYFFNWMKGKGFVLSYVCLRCNDRILIAVI